MKNPFSKILKGKKEKKEKEATKKSNPAQETALQSGYLSPNEVPVVKPSGKSTTAQVTEILTVSSGLGNDNAAFIGSSDMPAIKPVVKNSTAPEYTQVDARNNNYKIAKVAKPQNTEVKEATAVETSHSNQYGGLQVFGVAPASARVQYTSALPSNPDYHSMLPADLNPAYGALPDGNSSTASSVGLSTDFLKTFGGLTTEQAASKDNKPKAAPTKYTAIELPTAKPQPVQSVSNYASGIPANLAKAAAEKQASLNEENTGEKSRTISMGRGGNGQ